MDKDPKHCEYGKAGKPWCNLLKSFNCCPCELHYVKEFGCGTCQFQDTCLASQNGLKICGTYCNWTPKKDFTAVTNELDEILEDANEKV